MCYYSESDETATELDVALQVIRANNIATLPSYGEEGDGIIIGVYDAAQINTASSNFSDITIVDQSGDPDGNADHTEKVLQVLSSIAPNSDYYVACGSDYIGAIEYLIDNGVNIINASRRIGGTSGNRNQYSDVAEWLDHISCDHYVHFVKSSGNKDSAGVTNGAMAFNIITVGGFNDNDTTNASGHIETSGDSGSSYFAYSKRASTNKDAQKPDICAPSTGLTIGGTSNNGGTSYAAPQVSGAIALLCESTPELLTQQHSVKAILQASVLLDHPFNGVPGDSAYEQHGAGVLDVRGALWVAKQGRYETGLFTGSGTTTTDTYTIQVTSSDTKMRIAVANLVRTFMPSGNCQTGSPVQSGVIPNVDLAVYAPNNLTTPVATSTVSYGNVEIVEFDVETYGTYTIKVTRLIDSNNPAPVLPVNYALAWR